MSLPSANWYIHNLFQNKINLFPRNKYKRTDYTFARKKNITRLYRTHKIRTLAGNKQIKRKGVLFWSTWRLAYRLYSKPYSPNYKSNILVGLQFPFYKTQSKNNYVHSI
jgi:hypothetical protein